MEHHFLAGYVGGEPGFDPAPWYNPQGDCIVCVIANEATVAERIDSVLTIYKSAVDGRAIGYQIKGVSALVREFGWHGLQVESSTDAATESLESVSVTALLLAAYESGPKTMGRRQAYAAAMGSSAKQVLSRRELIPA